MPGPGIGSRSLEGLACPDDASDRPQTIAGIFDQRCDSLSRRDARSKWPSGGRPRLVRCSRFLAPSARTKCDGPIRWSSLGSEPWRRNTPTARSPPCWIRRDSDPGTKGRFTADKVQWIDMYIPFPAVVLKARPRVRDGYRGDGRCTVQEAAKQLNVNISTIAAWCRSGRLDGIQAVPHGPWWIRLTPEVDRGVAPAGAAWLVPTTWELTK